MPEADGVQWEFVDEGESTVRSRECVDCEREFVATMHRQKAGDHWCPECKPVESLAAAVERTLEEDSRPPSEVDVDEVFGR